MLKQEIHLQIISQLLKKLALAEKGEVEWWSAQSFLSIMNTFRMLTQEEQLATSWGQGDGWFVTLVLATKIEKERGIKAKEVTVL